jgi:hypothetical protein
MRCFAFAALVLASAQPAASHAQPRPVSPAAAAAVNDEMVAFGLWLGRLQEAQAPLQGQLASFQARWQAAVSSGDLRRASRDIRPLVAEMLAAIDRNVAALDALQPIEISSLPLPRELQPRALLVGMRGVNGNLRSAIRQFPAMLEAMERDDVRAFQRAADAMVASIRAALDGRILLSRAGLAAVPRGHSGWTRTNVELQVMRSVSRLFEAWPEDDETRTDARLAADLRAIAAEMEDAARRGPVLLGAELAQHRRLIASPAARTNPGAVAVTRRAIAVGEAGQGIYPLAGDFAAALRRAATRFDGGRVSMEQLGAVLTALSPLRQRFEQIGAAEIQALSAAR